MGRPKTACVFDRAPVLLGSSRNLARIREQTVSVRAVDAIDTLQQVEVLELASIENEIIRALGFRNSVHRKANPLINDQEEIDKQEGNDACVNDRRRQVRKK